MSTAEQKVKELIRVEKLSFAYDIENIIEDADFTINRNDVITVLGPNGGGKTTLLRILMGQLKQQKGSVSINGDRSRIFGYVPQYSTMDPPTRLPCSRLFYQGA